MGKKSVYQHYVEGLDENGGDWRDRFKPGSFGCHEALDRAAFLAALVDDLSSHPGILTNEAWHDMATEACLKLGDLYQAISLVHVEDK